MCHYFKKCALCEYDQQIHTVELQWLEHLRNHENMFETGVVRANECYSLCQVHFQYKKENYPKLSQICRNGTCSRDSRTSEKSRGKRAISVRATEVLLYQVWLKFLLFKLSITEVCRYTGILPRSSAIFTTETYVCDIFFFFT